jgi:cell division protein FtsB
MRFAILAACLMITAAPATFAEEDAADPQARIQALEAEVAALKIQNAELSGRLDELRALLSTKVMPLVAAGATPEVECRERLGDLVRKRDTLYTMGLQERHPDVVNMTAQIKAVSEECSGKQKQ